MKLVPFILTSKQSGPFTFTTLSLFLTHAGKSIWKTDEPGFVSFNTILEDYCEPNGFVIQRSHVDKTKNIVYLQVDAEKMNLSDFYTWDEAIAHPSKPECWRRFLFMKDAEKADWWSPMGLVEAEIQDYGNVHDLYFSILSFFPTV